MSAPPRKEVRPPLPRGPVLVVGLAHSGQDAGGAGERVRAVDSGHPAGAAGLEGEGVEVFLDTDGLAQLEGTRTVVKSPGMPREAPVIATALEWEIEVMGAKLRVRACYLLSPACASFDAFANFEQRGDRFREIVGTLG